MTTWQSFDLVLFGGTGDLAMRKLLPALYRRFVAGLFPADARIVGVARSASSRARPIWRRCESELPRSCRRRRSMARNGPRSRSTCTT